jgi:hypothetical protein
MGNNNASPNLIPSCPSPTGGACLDPAAQNVVALFPQPNVPPAQGFLFRFNPVDSNNQDSFDVRIDHQITSKDSFFGVFNYGNVDDKKPDPFPGIAGGGSFTGNINNKALMSGLSDVHTFSATKVNELKIGYTRYQVDARPFFVGQNLATQLGIPGINDPNRPATGGLPNIQISGLNNLGNGDWFPETLHENNYQLLDSFTYIRGHHALKLGGDLRRRHHGFFQTQNSRGDLFFNGQFTNPTLFPNVAVPLADFLIGYTQDVFRDAQTGTYGMRWWEFGTYFMDDYRVADKLTLNLGVRYDLYTPMVEDHNRLANFDFQTGLFVAPGVTPGTSRSGDVAMNWKNFSPRLGFAYSLGNDNKTAIRGGYGIFYDLQADQNDTELAYNPAPGIFGSQSLTASLGPTPVMILSQGPPAIALSNISNPSGRASAAFFHNPTTYIEEWNINVERQLMKDVVLQVGYVGTRGVHLTYLRNLNQATEPTWQNFAGPTGNEGRPYVGTVPNIAAIRTEGHDINLINHGLQVRFEKRSSRGWSMLNSYTYQHTIGQATETETPNSDVEPQNTYNLRAERGNVAPDFRHQFTSAWSY